MNEQTKSGWWVGLKNKPKKRCSTCNTSISRTNPMAKCQECGKNYCFDHIYGGMINDKMAQNEEVRNICEECKPKYEYTAIN